MVNYEQVWQMEDNVRMVVDSCVGAGAVRDMHWDRNAERLVLELSCHLSDEDTSVLLSQFNFSADYEGESEWGTIFSFNL